ncbi:hypothetical protein V6N13_015090 [Hibiscus sabdariffa]
MSVSEGSIPGLFYPSLEKPADILAKEGIGIGRVIAVSRVLNMCGFGSHACLHSSDRVDAGIDTDYYASYIGSSYSFHIFIFRINNFLFKASLK